MKKPGSGSPIASTTPRRTMKPSKATFSISTSSGIAERSPYVVSTIAVLGLIRSGLRRSKVTAAFSTSRPDAVLADRHQAVLVDRHQHAEAVRRRDDVVVHQPDPVEALLVRRLDAEVEAAGAAEVLLGRITCSGRSGARRAPSSTVCGVVGAGVVDHDHRVRLVLGRGQPTEHPQQQAGAVVGHHDDRDGLSVPVAPRGSVTQVPPVPGEVAAQPGDAGTRAQSAADRVAAW